MISLVMAGMNYPAPSGAVNVVLKPTTINLPSDKRIAVLAKKHQGKSVFLRLLAGLEKPVQGRIFSAKQLSPIVRYGALFHRRMSLFENINFFARMMDIDADALALAVDEFCERDGSIGVPIEQERGDQRRIAEIGLMSVLPFDCYLIDEILLMPDRARKRFFDNCVQRNAGAIFTTKHTQLARQYADGAIVIRDGCLYSFSSVDEGIKCLEG